MPSLELADELCVLIWRRGRGGGLPLGYPIEPNFDALDERTEVIDGEVDSVVRSRIESKEPDRAVGRVTEKLVPESAEWRRAQDILTARYDFETEVVGREERPRLMIRSRGDYHNQWSEQKESVLEQIPK